MIEEQFMKKSFAIELEKEAQRTAKYYSDPNRERNIYSETFEVNQIIPLSEKTAVVIFLKNTGKKAIAFFFFKKDRWDYFFPTDSHIIGMQAFPVYLRKIELENWLHNFKKEEEK